MVIFMFFIPNTSCCMLLYSLYYYPSHYLVIYAYISKSYYIWSDMSTILTITLHPHRYIAQYCMYVREIYLFTCI